MALQKVLSENVPQINLAVLLKLSNSKAVALVSPSSLFCHLRPSLMFPMMSSRLINV